MRRSTPEADKYLKNSLEKEGIIHEETEGVVRK
jgi:hypothetical protein